MNLKNYLFALFVMLVFFCRGNGHNPTWTDGIACIVYSHCTSCHNQNGIAPFSLTTYDEVYQNRFSIAASIQARSMPPFPPSQEKQKYAHANTLSQHEIDELVDWVNNFAPLGNANQIPFAPSYKTNFQLSTPDKILQIPNYTVNTAKDLYRCFVLLLNNSQQEYIQQIEVVPGNRDIVHHALIFQDTSLIPLNLDMADTLPGYTAFGSTGSPSSRLITGYTPGQGLFEYPKGFGAKINANSYLILQIHYPGGISDKMDSTQVRIKYGSNKLRNISTAAILNHSSTLINGPLTIPPNQVKTFYNQYKVNDNATITAIMPHMHLLGKSIKSYFVNPKGDTTTLIDIPQWDFHWQGFYQFQKPILIPAGSTLYGEGIFDNTSQNNNNPNNPPKTVNLGEGTDDEMFLIYFNYTAFLPGDTSLVIDTSSHYNHDASCGNIANSIKINYSNTFSIYPNPTNDLLFIDGLGNLSGFTLYGANGQMILSKSNLNCNEIDLSKIPSGIYYAQIKTAGNELFYKKVIKE